MKEWIDKARADLAAAVGDSPASVALGKEDIDEILDLARVAAHESGERTTAPVICYLVGLMRGRHPERDLSELIDAVSNRAPDE